MATVPTNMREIGWTGLKHSNGVIQEEWLSALDAVRGVQTYSDMLLDPVVGATVFAITNEMTRAEWSIKPNEDADGGAADTAAEFVESCFLDMSTSFESVLDEALSCLPYGWAYHEIVYKVRSGPNPDRPGESSKFSDGYLGWRKLPIRGQDSLVRWELDEHTGIQGMWQRQDDGTDKLIPIDRALLFRPKAHKNNPMGRSALRSAFKPWYRRNRGEEVEAIGLDRDAVGIPTIWLPPDWLTDDASPQQKAAVRAFQKIGENLRVDEQACVIMPLEYDANGNKVFDLTLLASPGAKTADAAGMIERYSREIAMTVLADVMLVGHEGTGSYALAEQKYDAFTRGLMGWLDAIAEVFSRHAIPRLLAQNGMDPLTAPTLEFSPIERVDLAKLGSYVTAISGAGFPLFPDEPLQEWLARVAGMPYTPMNERETIEKPTWELSEQEQAMADAKVEAVKNPAPGAKAPPAAAEVGKMNPYHDALGRFATAPAKDGGGMDAAETWAALSQVDYSPGETMAMGNYYDQGVYVNRALRAGTPASDLDLAGLDETIARQKLAQPVEVWRGTRDGMDLTVGSTFTDAGYVSTTVDRAIADRFTHSTGWNDTVQRSEGAALVRMKLPAGQAAAPMTEKAERYQYRDKGFVAEREREVVLPRGLTYRVTGEDSSGPVRVIDVEVVG